MKLAIYTPSSLGTPGAKKAKIGSEDELFNIWYIQSILLKKTNTKNTSD